MLRIAPTYLHSDTGQVFEDYRMKEWMTCCLQVKATGSRPNPWVTTNLAFEVWAEIFGSERLTGAVLDRLTHRCIYLGSEWRKLPIPAGQETIKLETLYPAGWKAGITHRNKKRTNNLTEKPRLIYF